MCLVTARRSGGSATRRRTARSWTSARIRTAAVRTAPARLRADPFIHLLCTNVEVPYAYEGE